MKDVRIKNRISECKIGRTAILFSSESGVIHREGNTVGKYMFAGMSLAIFIYLFLLTSSIFYALNAQKYSYNIEKLNTMAAEVGHDLNSDELSISRSKDLVNLNNKKDKVSYVNKNTDIAVTLK